MDLVSAGDPVEVLERIEAVTTRRRALSILDSSGVERRGDATRLVLAVRHPYGDPLRPVAIVSVGRDTVGTTRVRGEIRPSRLGQAWLAVFLTIAVLAAGSGVVSLARGETVLPLLVGAAFLAAAFVAASLSYGDRATLRALLADAVS